VRTIGDALNEKNISWGYFGGGFNAAARFDNGSKDRSMSDWHRRRLVLRHLQPVPIRRFHHGRSGAAHGAHYSVKSAAEARSISRPSLDTYPLNPKLQYRLIGGSVKG
jgi:hypothetical protein